MIEIYFYIFINKFFANSSPLNFINRKNICLENKFARLSLNTFIERMGHFKIIRYLFYFYF